MSTSQVKPSSSEKTPKYRSIAEEIRGRVKSGVLQPGERLPSLAEMRAQYGITPTTVERVYSVLREDGLIVREQGRGTFVAQPAVRPATAVIGVAGVTFDLQRYPYWAELMHGIREEVEKQGYEILLLGDTTSIRWEKVDGVLLCGSIGFESQHRLPFGMPRVAALTHVEGAMCVVADEAQGVRQALEHLIALGHERIGYLVSQRSQHRLEAYRRVLRHARIATRKEWIRIIPAQDDVPDVDFRQCAYDIVNDWLEETYNAPGVTALLTQSDETAIGAAQALRERGVRLPEEMSIVGFDGTPTSDYFSPRITSVRLPLKTIGATATQHLLGSINGANVPVATIALPTSLKPGQTTAEPFTGKPHPTKSLRGFGSAKK